MNCNGDLLNIEIKTVHRKILVIKSWINKVNIYYV